MRSNYSRRIRFEHLENRCMLAVVPGDYNFSGVTDPDDYDVWRADFGSVGTLPADGNGNNVVDAADYVVWRKNLGKTLADVPPDPPQTVSASVAGPTSVQVTWQAVTGATSYDVQRRRPNVTNDPFITVGDDVTGTSFTDTTVSSGTVYEYVILAQNTAGTSQPSQTTSVTAGSANLTAYRQQQFHDPDNPTNAPIYAPFAKSAVPEHLEESTTQGPGIRPNRDDDNNNGLIDRFEGGIAIPLENDLIEVRIDRLPGQGNLVLRAGDDLQLYYTYDKEDPVPLDDDAIFTENLPFVSNMATVFVEWVTNGHGTDMLELVDPLTSMVIDTIVFHTFHSVIIVLGGEGQVPADPVLVPGNHGTFSLAIDLYRNEGYDVRMYDEDDVGPFGGGPAYDELVNSINRQLVEEVAIYGYSHGGGSTYDLSWLLNENVIGNEFDITQPFTVTLTGYIDAITNTTIGAENRRPPLTDFHVNQYQQNTGIGGAFLNGGPSNGDDDLDRSNLLDVNGNPIVHGTIDDNMTILSFLKTRILQRVTR